MAALEMERLILKKLSPNDWENADNELSKERSMRYKPRGIFGEKGSGRVL